MHDLDLREERRTELVHALVAALGTTAPTATVSLQGSLAEGGADRFSDIDLLLQVDGGEMDRCLRAIPEVLQTVLPIRLLRVDPDTTTALGRRLIFVSFHGVPLFWRLDLEVVAEPPPASQVRALHDVPWSPPASALMNALASIKALARADPQTASDLLTRGFARIGEPRPAVALSQQPGILATACAQRSPDLDDLAVRIVEASSALLRGT